MPCRAVHRMLAAVSLVAALLAALLTPAGPASAAMSPSGGKLVGVGELGHGRFGQSVAVSGDGSLVAIGAATDNSGAGAVWVYRHSAAGLAKGGQKLTALDASGPAMFGNSVAIANDGSRMLIGGPNDSNGSGAAWIFRRVGTEWIQQGPKITPSNAIGQAFFGTSVAMSGASGDVIVIGAPGDNGSIGAAWAFAAKSNGGYAQQGPKITASDETGAGRFGYGVALSADGVTTLIGGPYDDGIHGGAWIFTRTANTWSQDGPRLIGSGEIGTAAFGYSVALSSDGTTAAVGAPADAGNAGATWTFDRVAQGWRQRGDPIRLGDGRQVGWALALSGDGDTLLLGSPGTTGFVGTAKQLHYSHGYWSVQTAPLTGAGETGAGGFGTAVALTRDGSVAVVGALHDANDLGAAWLFVDRPVLWSVTPGTGTAAGGTPVRITGTAIGGATTVRFGSKAIHEITVNSSTEIIVLTPAGQAGTVDITVTTPAGTSAVRAADRFTYYGRPSLAHVSLTGVARRVPRLAFTITAARRAPQIRSALFVPPKGLTFSTSSSSLRSGIVIRSGTKRLRFTAKAAQGTLSIQLAKPAGTASVTIMAPALRASTTLANQARHHTAARLSFLVRTADASNGVVDLTLRVTPH